MLSEMEPSVMNSMMTSTDAIIAAYLLVRGSSSSLRCGMVWRGSSATPPRSMTDLRCRSRTILTRGQRMRLTASKCPSRAGFRRLVIIRKFCRLMLMQSSKAMISSCSWREAVSDPWTKSRMGVKTSRKTPRPSLCQKFLQNKYSCAAVSTRRREIDEKMDSNISLPRRDSDGTSGGSCTRREDSASRSPSSKNASCASSSPSRVSNSDSKYE
mmetsp:Transcript_15108/g.42939  ORF Transcript_15108/g.42939 Transcript_15108/m.42939 type:complete len:213 (+) Transcript_15108:3611-4249(+)